MKKALLFLVVALLFVLVGFEQVSFAAEEQSSALLMVWTVMYGPAVPEMALSVSQTSTMLPSMDLCTKAKETAEMIRIPLPFTYIRVEGAAFIRAVCISTK